MTLASPFWTGRTVCVTGGTGFLGLQIVNELLDRGATVRILALAPTADHPLRLRAGVELIEGDVRDLDSVRRAVAGCDTVFHTAAVVGVWGPALERMWSVNVDGTKNVLASASKCARIVHTSSIMAIGAPLDGEVLDEHSPFNLGSIKLPYCHAKRAAEELVLASGRDVVVANPGFLVGPDDFEPSVIGRLCVRFWKGRLPFAPPGGINLVDVRDAALGHLRAAEFGRSGGRYILGGANETFAALLAELAAVACYSPRGLPRLPSWALTAAAGLSELRAWFTGREPYPSLGHARVNRFRWFYSSDKARAEIGFASRSLGETLADTYEWFRGRTAVEPRGLNRWWMRPRRAA